MVDAKPRGNSENGEHARAYAFFSHTACEYFPCHETDAPEDFNCLFCFCPLYALGAACGGDFSYTARGVKDCSRCLFPHQREHYGAVMARFPALAALAGRDVAADYAKEDANMNQLEGFYDAIAEGQTVTLATAADGRVTMRAVSPVCYEGSVLIFTAGGSKKYAQLRANPLCCLAIDGYYAEAVASFCGKTMLPENAPLRKAYAAKFPDAFDEDATFGGLDAEFILLRPVRLTGWAAESDEADAPRLPFELEVKA